MEPHGVADYLKESSMNDIDPHILPVYIKYERLTAKSVGGLLSSWGTIADVFSRAYCTEFLIGERLIPTLEIDSVHTGDSIKFTFGEGWLPSLSKDSENDIIINVPKKLGIPLLIGYLTLSASQQVLDVQNTYLDNRIKQIELQLKQTEIDKIRESRFEESQKAMSQIKETVSQLIYNHNFVSINIYDIDIIKIVPERSNNPDDYKKWNEK